MSVSIPIITEHNDEFEISSHIDDSATDILLQESWNSVDVKGGRWLYKGELCVIPEVTDIGSDTNNYIIVTIFPGTGVGVITAASVAPDTADYETSRLLGVINFETDTASGTYEYPTTPPWDGEEVIVNFTQHLRSTQYTWDADSCNRWKVTIDGDGYINVGDGSWEVHGDRELWEDATAYKINAVGATDTPVDTDTISDGEYNIIAFWDSGTSPYTEPVVDNTGWTLKAGVASASEFSSGIGLTELPTDRNWVLVAVVTKAGSTITIDQRRCDDFFSNVHSNNEEAVAWVGSDYFTWASGADATPSRPLIQANPLDYPEKGGWQLGDEHKQADDSKNMFVSVAAALNSSYAEAQGPVATPLWVSVDGDYLSTYAERDQKTLEVSDGASNGLSVYNHSTLGLYGINGIDITEVRRSTIPVFEITGNPVGGNVEGRLAWPSIDSEHPNRGIAGSSQVNSLTVPDYDDVISIYGFESAEKWQVGMQDKVVANYPKTLTWKHPVKWEGNGGGNGSTPTPWADMIIDVDATGITLDFNYGNVTWAAGESNFVTGSSDTFDPIGEWIGGTPGSFCDDVDDCIGTLVHPHENHTFNSDDHDTEGVDRYIINSGTASRNNMSGEIGNQNGDAVIAPDEWALRDGNGSDTVDWYYQELKPGTFTPWTVTSTLTAGGSTGALVVEGGVNIKDNLIVQDNTDAGAGVGSIVTLGGASIARVLRSEDITDAGIQAGAIISQGGAYINRGIYVKARADGHAAVFEGHLLMAGDCYVETLNAYYHAGNKGGTGDDDSYVSGGLVMDKFGKTLKIKEQRYVNPTDMVMVWE